MSFGKKLRQLREEKSLTQTKLAEVLETSLKTISNYEVKGTRPRRMGMFEKIAKYFDVDINYLKKIKTLYLKLFKKANERQN